MQAQSPQLQLKQTQSLVMTQQLQQSIKLLQYNALELQAFIAMECEKNPFLQSEDLDYSSDSAENTGEELSEPPEVHVNDEIRAVDSDSLPAEESWQEKETGGADNTWDYAPQERTAIISRSSDGDIFDRDDIGERKPTLKEHLLKQLPLEIPDPILQRIGAHLIDLVDESGYLKEDIHSIAKQLGTSEGLVEQVLVVVQRFDPAGVCARSLKECLSLQLIEQDRFDPAMRALIENLELLAAAKLDQLKRKCGVDDEDLSEMIAEIRALNPKPGLEFEHEITQTALPDILVKRDGNKWKIELNNATLPRVLVNREYHAEIVTHAKGADKKYVSEQMNNANWLAKALDQRANTIVKVATEIVMQQESFFKMGIHHLKPLTLKDVATATGYHESTVSRVTTGKYMMTPRGLFELKYFFTSGLSHSKGGEDVSSQTVKHLIKEAIDKEPASAPLSDDDIAAALKKQNINVARRTVAKYREALGIPSSMHRRRLKIA